MQNLNYEQFVITYLHYYKGEAGRITPSECSVARLVLKMKNPFLTTILIEVHPVDDERFEIRECLPHNHRALFARTRIVADEAIIGFAASEVRTEPDRYTVQIDRDSHIVLDPVFLQYINHHCNPNVMFDCRTMELRALRAIEPGDELTFFYPSTEWSMDEPFACHCGSPLCLGQIRGAAFLSREVLAEYDLNPHITDLVRERKLKVAKAG